MRNWWASGGRAGATVVLTNALSLTGLMGQGLNNLWMGGFSSSAGPPFGGTNLDFISGSANIYYVNREMDFRRTAASITDSLGSLEFVTNGFYIADAAGDTMLNGTGINPSAYTSNAYEGLHIPQSHLILPGPDQPGLYYLFHGTVDDQAGPNALYLYLSIIDMSQNGGLGAVVIKNQVLISDELNVGRLTAAKHANGRDWWVVCHKLNSTTFYKMLVTPAGVGIPMTQDIGVFRPPDVGQSCFSPDGNRFAYYWCEDELDIFDFDRCTGLFSDPVHIDVDSATFGMGVAFSPSSQFLYVASVVDVYQYDVTAVDIAASMVHIAEWDSFYSPAPPFATVFDIAQLAPDGKIYIATGNSTDKLHVINSPDLPGLACDMVQHGVTLPTYFMDSCPNHPNYHLGPVDGSICDSLGINTLTPGPSPGERGGIRVLPNPNTGVFTLSYPAQATVGTLEVRDLSGKVILRERIPQWSTVHRVVLEGEAAGMYQCGITWGARSAAVRVVIEP